MTKVALAMMAREIMNHPSYSPDLELSDFNLSETNISEPKRAEISNRC
jgi:hypothetical protein